MPIAPVRAEPSAASEQVTQLVFGQGAVALESTSGWTRVRVWDGTIGWVDGGQIETPLDGQAACVEAPFVPVYGDPSCQCEVARLPMNAVIRCATGCARWPRRFAMAAREAWVRRKGVGLEPFRRHGPATAARIAIGMVGAPYEWGGVTADGFDCSGLVQAVLARCGVLVPRDAWQQMADDAGLEPVAPGSERNGDLIFYLGTEDRHGRGVSHVGIVVPGGNVVHAHGRLGVASTPATEMTGALGYRVVGVRRPRW